MDVLIAPIYFLTAHSFLALFLFAALIILLFSLSKSSAALARSRFLALLLILCAFLNIFFGHWLSGHLVHTFGTPGQGVATDSYSTGTVYNNHRVYGHHVLLRLADGTTRESSFRSDSFNIYPWHNAVTYPVTGDRFNVRYLPHFPSAFIILSNDDSPWALESRCGDLEADAYRASTRSSFAPSDPNYRAQATGALNIFLRSPCTLIPALRAHYQQRLQELQQQH